MRSLLVWLAVLGLCLKASGVLCAQALPPGTFANPIHPNGADPFVAWYGGNYYLLCTDTPNDAFEINGPHLLTVRAARSLGGMRDAKPTVVYRIVNNPKSTHRHNQFYESPELYPSGGRWYIYYTEYPNTVHVLESDGGDLLGGYHYKATLAGNIYDATVLRLPDGRQYLLGSTYGSLVIQPLSNPWTTAGAQTAIAARTEAWEHLVIEAPSPVWHEGKLWLLYSCGTYNKNDYAVGALRFEGGDPLRAESWKKLPDGPLFTGAPEAKVWCAGAACAFLSPDGKETWIAYSDYNAYDPRKDFGAGPRTIMAQPLRWRPDGTPFLDKPFAPGVPLPLPSGEPR